jgi:hypothetical protein
MISGEYDRSFFGPLFEYEENLIRLRDKICWAMFLALIWRRRCQAFYPQLPSHIRLQEVAGCPKKP